MSDQNFYDAFEISPVPEPGPDATPPEPFRGIYGMPMFVTVPTADLAESARFWCDALGFVELFSIPGQMIHLRRWAFQDVLLVPTTHAAHDVAPMTVSFACVLSQVDDIADTCETLRPGSTTGPRHTPWNTVDVEVTTPEQVRVVLTAAKQLDPSSQEAQHLADVGITRRTPTTETD